MKIVYAAPIWGSSKEEGVIKKVLEQKKAFMQLGYDVRLIRFSDFNRFFEKTVADRGVRKLRRYYAAYNKMIEAIKKEKPDCIYVRDVMWLFNLYTKLSKIAPTFIEIQTDVVRESKYINKKRYIIERLCKRSYLKRVSGKICITGEIVKIESKYNNKPSIVLGNGIDSDEIEFLPKMVTNSLINIIFLGSPGMPWHGIERLIDSYLKAPNRERFMLHIVGYEDFNNLNNSNIKFYGFIKNSEEIDKIASMADLGMGSLSLYYNNLSEAAPLKLRYYLSRGLPVVISHGDVDIDDSLPFVMRVPNDNSAIDFLKIEEFYNVTKDLRRNGETLKFAIEKLTWTKKMGKILKFMENIVTKPKWSNNSL